MPAEIRLIVRLVRNNRPVGKTPASWRMAGATAQPVSRRLEFRRQAPYSLAVDLINRMRPLIKQISARRHAAAVKMATG